VIGFDDNPAGLFGSVALTTIKQPLFAMGEEAVKIIYEAMQSKEPTLIQKILSPDLIIRESCAPPSS
jgi:DNA-binding LacI/PurR family transcriptional regulator